MSQVLKLKLKALILDTIHSIEVVQTLIHNSISDAAHWLWQKQLRFYLKDGKENKHTSKLENKQTNRQSNRRAKQTSKLPNKQANRQADKQTDKQTNKRTNTQTNKRTNTQTNKRTNMQTNKQTHKRTNNSIAHYFLVVFNFRFVQDLHG